jgi:organic hydroperoxide reductase OsmC/OhrA
MRHEYAAHLTWNGNLGNGTETYVAYSREHRVEMNGKPPIVGSADAAFRGDPQRHNPEDLLLAALSGCHMLAYLALCARRGVNVLAYEDSVRGTLVTRADGGGKFESVTLTPVVTIAPTSDRALAAELHHTAHEQCFIASSCSMPVHHQATILAASSAGVHP